MVFPAVLAAGGTALAAPVRSSDFTEQECLLAAGGQLDTETEIAGTDLLGPWYQRLAGGPCLVVARHNPFPDPSLALLQLALDVGTTQPRHLDLHVAVWSTNQDAKAALAEGQINFPLGLDHGALQPYAGAGLTSDRLRRVELDTDAIAWAGLTYVTPDLYPIIAGRGVGQRDRLQLRPRISLEADLPTDPKPDRPMAAVRPQISLALPGALGWLGFSGFLVAHDQVRIAVGRPWEHTTYASLFYGPVEWRTHPFVRGRWLRANGATIRDLSIGLVLRGGD